MAAAAEKEAQNSTTTKLGQKMNANTPFGLRGFLDYAAETLNEEKNEEKETKVDEQWKYHTFGNQADPTGLNDENNLDHLGNTAEVVKKKSKPWERKVAMTLAQDAMD